MHWQGAPRSGRSETSDKRETPMGDVIKLAERRRHGGRGVAAAGARALPRAVLLRSRLPVHVPRGRARRARVRRGGLDASLRRARCAAAALADDDVAAAAVRRAAEERAAALRLPLVWPERFPAEVPAAMRVAARAQEAGRGAAFVLAATRLAFCGGFDLDDPEILAEAAAAAGVVLDECLHAARDEAATARSREPAGSCSPSAPTGCRRSASGARCTGASAVSARRSPRAHRARRVSLLRQVCGPRVCLATRWGGDGRVTGRGCPGVARRQARSPPSFAAAAPAVRPTGRRARRGSAR